MSNTANKLLYEDVKKDFYINEKNELRYTSNNSNVGTPYREYLRVMYQKKRLYTQRIAYCLQSGEDLLENEIISFVTNNYNNLHISNLNKKIKAVSNMKENKYPSQPQIIADFIYNKSTGELFNKLNSKLPYSFKDGYKYISYRGETLKHNRLVYTMFMGDITEGMVIDHIDDDKLNDRADNLQMLTISQNNYKHHNKNIIGKRLDMPVEDAVKILKIECFDF